MGSAPSFFRAWRQEAGPVPLVQDAPASLQTGVMLAAGVMLDSRQLMVNDMLMTGAPLILYWHLLTPTDPLPQSRPRSSLWPGSHVNLLFPGRWGE